MADQYPKVLLPSGLQQDHRSLVLRYLEDSTRLSGTEWPKLMEAFDLLNAATVVTEAEQLSFSGVYRQQVEEQYAAAFMERLYTVTDVEKETPRLRATVSRVIVRALIEARLYRPEVPDSRFLLAYCLYWWYAFSKGYAFEVYIFRDLAGAGIQFRAHDLRSPAGRRSPYDLEVLGFRGDVKTSTYFLWLGRAQSLPHDFYITRLYTPGQRSRTLVVFAQESMWEEIDGETPMTIIESVPDVLPTPARLQHRDFEIIVADYEMWKQKVLRRQQEESNEDSG